MEKKQQVDVIQIIPNLALGGAEIIVENLAKELVNSNLNVLVVSLYSYNTAISLRIQEAGIPIVFLDKKPGFDIRIFFKIFKVLKEFKPRIIHSHLSATLYSVPASVLSRINNRVHTVHSMAEKEGNKIIRKIYKIFYKFYKLVPVTISSEVEKSFYKTYGKQKESIAMIHNGIDLQKFTKKENYEIDFKNINITHVGSFKEPKNQKMIVGSFSKVIDKYSGANLNFIGNGEMINSVKEYVKELNISENINFIGEVGEISSYLSETDIFILPSLWEGMPISLIEAMASGLPIIATRVGGIPDMITDDFTGILIDSNEDMLTEALFKLLKNKKIRTELGQNAYIKSLEFSSKKMSDEYAKLYEFIGGK